MPHGVPTLIAHGANNHEDIFERRQEHIGL